MRWHLVIFVLLFPALTSMAEPSAPVRYLMREPVTALDFGMYQLELRYTNPELRLAELPVAMNTSTAALYDWDANRIHLITTVMPFGSAPQDRKEICRRMLQYIRLASCIDISTGKQQGPFNIAQLFHSRSFEKADAPKNIEDEVLAIIDLKVSVLKPGEKDGIYRPDLECSGRLLGSDVLFKG